MSSSLSYSYIEKDAPSQIPPRKVNGGLYTGTEFEKNAKWGNVSIEPEAHILVTQNLLSANPPPDGIHHIPGYTREGNNTQYFPNHKKYSNLYNIQPHN